MLGAAVVDAPSLVTAGMAMSVPYEIAMSNIPLTNCASRHSHLITRKCALRRLSCQG